MDVTERKGVAPTAGTPVRITLACGWCSRRIDDLTGEMETATGRMRVSPASAPFRLMSGRPICPACGGPLFVDDWTTVRPQVEPEYEDPDEAEVSHLAA